MKRNRFTMGQFTGMLREPEAMLFQGKRFWQLGREGKSLFRKCSGFRGLKWIQDN